MGRLGCKQRRGRGHGPGRLLPGGRWRHERGRRCHARHPASGRACRLPRRHPPGLRRQVQHAAGWRHAWWRLLLLPGRQDTGGCAGRYAAALLLLVGCRCSRLLLCPTSVCCRHGCQRSCVPCLGRGWLGHSSRLRRRPARQPNLHPWHCLIPVHAACPRCPCCPAAALRLRLGPLLVLRGRGLELDGDSARLECLCAARLREGRLRRGQRRARVGGLWCERLHKNERCSSNSPSCLPPKPCNRYAVPAHPPPRPHTHAPPSPPAAPAAAPGPPQTAGAAAPAPVPAVLPPQPPRPGACRFGGLAAGVLSVALRCNPAPPWSQANQHQPFLAISRVALHCGIQRPAASSHHQQHRKPVCTTPRTSAPPPPAAAPCLPPAAAAPPAGQAQAEAR